MLIDWQRKGKSLKLHEPNNVRKKADQILFSAVSEVSSLVDKPVSGLLETRFSKQLKIKTKVRACFETSSKSCTFQ